MVSTWLDDHLENFVRPKLGHIPNLSSTGYWVQRFEPRMLAALHAIWYEAKRRAKGAKILLAGRDVFLFEIFARMEDYPSIFRSDISSCVAPHVFTLNPELKEEYQEAYLIDTGYKGSVPKAMGIKNWGLISASSLVGKEKQLRQVFPKCNRGPIISLATELEGCPKYWNRAEWFYDLQEVKQSISSDNVFRDATILTRHVAASFRGEMLKRVRRVL